MLLMCTWLAVATGTRTQMAILYMPREGLTLMEFRRQLDCIGF
jgi:hypothetical protein